MRFCAPQCVSRTGTLPAPLEESSSSRLPILCATSDSQFERIRSLIGEHIDYVLFGAFPAAIERDILIACGLSISPSEPVRTGSVHAHNLDPKYPPQTFAPMLKSPGPSAAEEADAAASVHVEPWQLDIDKRELRWESYVKAGYYVSSCVVMQGIWPDSQGDVSRVF